MNASSPIDLEKYLRLDKITQRHVFSRNLFLYTSLVFALIIAAIATMARIWIIRYGRKLNTPHPGSPRSHAMERQDMYDGSRSWKLGGLIESLPIFILIDVLLFGLFILLVNYLSERIFTLTVTVAFFSDSIFEKDLTIGFVVVNVFQLGLCYLSNYWDYPQLTACAGCNLLPCPLLHL